ncbi:GNAT family N-acetyltransferase [Aureispira anguillae]|uniref:GNAT family N-acetyltransferase n=1 Tax=Aureispira anguillae TaxID=2864201 RepID=A0A916DSS5_9BACT|nr:GNAT family protein [Aureispira anguillae]BDS12081.1 GNAT family N-acetyltransferase [Aureispira anguillae]
MIKTLNSTAFNKFPILKSKRLTMRSIEMCDAQEIFDMQTDDLVLRYIAKQKPESLEEVENLIQNISDAYQKQEMLCWAAVIRDGERIIGTCGFNRIEKDNLRAEIGGALSPRYWGVGVAYEAVKQIIDYGLNELGLHTIVAKVDANNRSAIFLLEQLGFVLEGHFKDRMYFEGRFYDMKIYTKFNRK